jgi:hypothetical protein
MLKRKLALMAVTLISAASLSGNALALANCAGTVKFSLKWDTQCNGALAYSLNDGSSRFFCVRDNTEAALVLTAQASGADLIVRLADSNLTSCAQNSVEYTTPTYVIVTSPT